MDTITISFWQNFLNTISVFTGYGVKSSRKNFSWNCHIYHLICVSAFLSPHDHRTHTLGRWYEYRMNAYIRMAFVQALEEVHNDNWLTFTSCSRSPSLVGLSCKSLVTMTRTNTVPGTNAWSQWPLWAPYQIKLSQDDLYEHRTR